MIHIIRWVLFQLNSSVIAAARHTAISMAVLVVTNFGWRGFQDVAHPTAGAFALEPLGQGEATREDGVMPLHRSQQSMGDAWVVLNRHLSYLMLT